MSRSLMLTVLLPCLLILSPFAVLEINGTLVEGSSTSGASYGQEEKGIGCFTAGDSIQDPFFILAQNSSPVEKSTNTSPVQTSESSSQVQKSENTSPVQKSSNTSTVEKSSSTSPIQRSENTSPVQKANRSVLED
ncbi:hypothetical protein D3OALGA1CA_4449 [Olavius algarvensis associated proteobacterium Delta 3]|nr:hypothetical protein D3OALGB2SA_3669 [Olavius algarvensis associated proteobacterium Delta 3]CAB5151446.1 hypothetical protein D3OALGA1CA_4449 [Olavius algarvensis associated proteobacterium Delta 3]